MFRTLIHTAARFPRTTRVLLAACFVIPFVLGTAYLFATGPSGHASALAEYAYYLGTLIAFVSLWLLLRNLFDDDRIFPIQAFWHTLVVGFIYVVLRSVTLALLPGGFSASLAPLNPLSAVSASVHTLLAANLIFVLLLRFRRLVLYRRTRKSQWYWRLMLGFMAATATIDILLSILSLETENWPTEPRIITGGIAVIFMAVNCFRLSWIVRLSSKRKALTILLSLLLLSLLVESFLGLFQEYITGPDSLMEGTRYMDYLMAYNSGIGGFIVLGGVFGSLYCVTTILSLLFHLPTTVDFQRGKDEMAAMQSLTSLVKEVFDPDKLASTIAASPVEAGSATSAWLAVADLESGSLKPRILATKNIAAEIVAKIDTAALYREVTRSNKAILLQRALVDRRVQVLPGDGIRSLFVVPLSARNQVLGALFVAKNMESSFENDDLEAVSMYAAQAALALENARLFKEQVESERLARELAIAREVQQKLMPERAPTVEGLSIATSSVTAFEVGGDYHDFAELEDGRLAVIVADVAGKGASAAFYMAELQGAFNALAHIVPDPKDLLRHINRALGSSLEKNVFITTIYAVLDVDRAELSVARAGHCPAAVVHHTGKARYMRSGGMGLGLDRGSLFNRTLEVERIQLHPGDIIALFTDGLVEARSAEGDEYGYDRCLAVLLRHRHEDASGIQRALMDDINRYRDASERYGDDLTLVILKWHGASAEPVAS